MFQNTAAVNKLRSQANALKSCARVSEVIFSWRRSRSSIQHSGNLDTAMTMSFGDLLTKKMNIAAGAENAMNIVPKETPTVMVCEESANHRGIRQDILL